MRDFYKTAFAILSLLTSAPFAALADGKAFLDSAASRFARQMMIYPQEKIYAQTDKPHYMAGEDVWFRVYLTDAMSHKLDTTSRYVYAELISPADSSVVRRAKIRPVEGAYHGRISLPAELPEGAYQLRFYTRFMESLGDSYFFKRQITVTHPYPTVRHADAPGEDEAQAPDGDYDVAFFPEGGSMPSLTATRIAFKALNTDGLGEDVAGVVMNEKGDTVTTFRSQHLGMGAFMMYSNAGEKYHAACRSGKGVEKRFELPPASPNHTSLKTKWLKERLYINVSGTPSAGMPTPLYVIAHCRGNIGYMEQWDGAKDHIVMSKRDLPSGVTQILLVDAHATPISERLVFNINEANLAKASFSTDKPAYSRRERIAASLALTDADGVPLQGSLSVSVTDDRDVQPDARVSILSTLLLTSDLRGHVEDPAYYFREKSAKAAANLDVLMMTQGWRRYSIENMLKGAPDKPTGYIELGSTVSGTVKGGLMMNKAAASYPVTILSLRHFLLQQATTDSDGRFIFNMPEMQDSIQYVVQGNTKKGGEHVELFVDPEVFPKVPAAPPHALRVGSAGVSDGYLKKAEQKYTLENGLRMVNLEDVEVRAARPKKGKSMYSSPFNIRVSAEQIEKMHTQDVLSVLRRMAGVMIFGDKISIQGSGNTPLIYVDEVEVDVEMLKDLPVEVIDEVEVVKSAQAAIFGSRGGNGVILATTKSGFEQKLRSAVKFNIKTVTPLGYQVAKEFYSPRYETQQQRDSAAPDLRTTVYWNPNVAVQSDGKAAVSFYAADAPQSYSVVIEGVAADGQLVHAVEKIAGKK
jgi:hypothetical protein